MNDELRKLIEAQCDGTAGVAQRDRLQQFMADDPQAVRAYVQYLDLHAQLQWQGRGGQELSGITPEMVMESGPTPVSRLSTSASLMAQAKEFFSRQTPMSLSIAALVIGVLVTAMAFMAPPFYRAITARDEAEEIQPPRVVAEITRLRDAVWAKEQLAVEPGTSLTTGQLLDLREGVAEITFENGTLVLLQGPARMRLTQTDACRLLDGRLTAKMSPRENSEQTPRFLVETAIAPVVDLGTEFGVSVRGSRLLDVHVFDGQVAVETSLYIPERLLLNAGDALYIDTVTHAITQSKAERSRFAMAVDFRTPDRWRQHASALRKDPDLVAYYTFESDAQNPQRVVNLGSAGAALNGINHGAQSAIGRWDDKPALYVGGVDSGDQVDLGNRSIKQLGFTGSFTVAVWFRIAELSASWRTIIAKGDSAWRLHFDRDTERLAFGTNGLTGDPPDLIAGRDVVDDQWHLATIVLEVSDNGHRKLLYIDGRLDTTQVLNEPIATNNYQVLIGENAEKTNRHFGGWIDELAIFSRALTATEVNNFFQAGSPVDKSHLSEAN